MSDKTFKDSPMYPVLFMLATCVIFVGVLAVMFRSSEAKIEAYKQNAYQGMILGLLANSISEASGESKDDLLREPQVSYTNYIKEIKLPGLDRKVFAAVVNDSTIAYCFDIGGKGLWGTMRALAALSLDCKTLLGIVIYEQMETPGLGARIGEEWFLAQFRNVTLYQPDGTAFEFSFIPEGQKAVDMHQIQQITGATITSVSVLKMLRDEINLINTVNQQQAQ
ncbi:MAG: FMN-binding protein [Candidatus Cloacimonetes bacterium]|nr:FMN-binding protein [Candidatus Cloacimonadota bacterium]